MLKSSEFHTLSQ